MSYTTPQKLIDLFGVVEVASWSSQDNGTICSPTSFTNILNEIPDNDQEIANNAVNRCNSAILLAGLEIDSHLNNSYPLPLNQDIIDNSILPIIAAYLTIFHLSDDGVTEEILRKAKWAREQLKQLAQGIIVLKNIENYVKPRINTTNLFSSITVY